MLFCLTAEYTPQALNAMRENPNTNRRHVATQLLEASRRQVDRDVRPGALVIRRT